MNTDELAGANLGAAPHLWVGVCVCVCVCGSNDRVEKVTRTSWRKVYSNNRYYVCVEGGNQQHEQKYFPKEMVQVL